MSKLPAQHKPWEQYPDETDTAYHRFIVYLEMGQERSLDKARQKLGKKSGYVRQLETWSSRYNWVERVKAYDNHIIKQSLKNKEDLLDRARARLLNRLDDALDKLFEMMDEPIYFNNSEVSETDEEVKRVSVSSNMANQIKIVHDLMDRVGLVAPESTVDPTKNEDDATYIQNIYNRIENHYGNSKNNNEED